MEPEFLTYRSFNDPELLTQLTDILKEHHIDYLVEEDYLAFNPGFRVQQTAEKKYDVKIRPDDFDKIEEILGTQQADIDEIDPDYYLFVFSDEELMDILRSPDEWSHHDYILARKILHSRGVDVEDSTVRQLKAERLENLKKPEPSQQFWIFAGYVSVIFAGIAGVFIGWHLKNHKKTLPNGDRIYAYTDNDRQQGTYIFYLSIAAVLITVTLRFFVLTRLF